MKPAPKGSVLYTPPLKRQRILPPSPTSNNTCQPKQTLLAWIYTTDAVAPCFIRDIFGLRKNEKENFYWLGAVPCRSAKIVGIVVGVQVYESRSLYTLDDGTGVIDCVHYMQPNNVHPPKPVPRVGLFVQVIGVIRTFRESKEIRVSELEICGSSNDELYHTRVVLERHRTAYSSKYDFVIPASTKVLSRVPLKETPNPSNGVVLNPPFAASSKPTKTPSPIKKVPLFQRPSMEAGASSTRDIVVAFVENTIKSLVEHKVIMGKPYAGATKDEIVDVLKKDNRWRWVGIGMVDDALKTLEAEDRVWKMGQGKWDLTE